MAIFPLRDIQELIKLGRSIEETELRVQRFCPPPTNARLLVEPDFVYRKQANTNPVCSVQTNTSSTKSSALVTSTENRKDQIPICWNCEKGHRFKQCTEPRRIFCFKCGRSGACLPGLQDKKRQSGSAISRPPNSLDNLSVTTSSPNNLIFDKQPVLDYIIDHAVNDQRPFPQVSIYGRTILALLDSDASRTILGGPGWSVLRKSCRVNSSRIRECTIANGQVCKAIGSVYIPIVLRDRTRVFEVLVVPSLPHQLILEIDFWVKMGIIPDLNTGEWHFKNNEVEKCHMLI